MRIGDAEREAVAEQLRQAHAEGRLDSVEFEERIERCNAAKFGADLRALTADLPSGAPAGPLPHMAVGHPPQRTFMLVVAVFAAIAVTGAVIHAVFHIFWIFPLLFIARMLSFGRGRRHWGQQRAGY
ncbi:MAG: DUF1707 domain-containing protein [Solirubrobacterales bacterium]|nr:DUF1707 domain-containing protein [Solirubrobacterales bacterium]